MAKAWKDVIASPQYQQLTPEQQSAAQSQYFNEVVAPQAGDQVDAARQQFYSAYPLPAQPQPQASPAVSQEENARQENVVNNANGFDRFMFGVLNGLMDVGKGVGLFKDMTPEEQAAIKSVQQKLAAKPSTSQDVGEFVGQAAPFLGGGGLIAQAPAGAARLAAAAGLGAAEGGIVAKGTGNDVTTGAAVGAVAGPLAELAAPIIGKAANAVSKRVRGTPSAATSQAAQLDDMAKVATKATDVNPITGNSSGINELASSVKPDSSVLQAARNLGIEDALTPGMYSTNPTYRAFENALASTPGNKLYHSQREAIGQLGQKADQFISDFGGSLDKDFLNQRVKSSYEGLRQGLKKQEDILYNQIRSKIPTRAPVETSNTVKAIEDIADDVGGLEKLKSLYPQLSKTLEQIDPNTSPTYGLLDAVRRQVGTGLGKALDKGPYGSIDTRHLGILENALIQDQGAAAARYGAQESWNLAREIGRKRFAVQAAAINNLGKDLDKGIIQQLQQAIVDMSQGKGGDFSRIVSNLSDDMVQPAVATAMNKAFTANAKSPGQQLGVPGFVKWYGGISRNKSNMQALSRAIGYPATRRLRNIYDVAAGMQRAGSEKVYSSSQIDRMMSQFAGEKGVLGRIYGIGKDVAKAEGVTSLLGVPGAGTAGVLFSLLRSTKNSRMSAADDLIASPAFKNLSKRIAAGKVENSMARRAADASISKTKPYIDWAKTLTDEEKSNLARVGLVAYLSSSDPSPTEQQQEQR
ncbi:DNA transfer protein [Serratia marcescens]|nr:DNA transfer protein [Serratia marcescens]